MSDTQARSITKTFSWRVVATLTTIILVYSFTGELTIAASVGGIEVFLKLFLYYVHERLWSAIPWGEKKGLQKDLLHD